MFIVCILQISCVRLLPSFCCLSGWNLNDSRRVEWASGGRKHNKWSMCSTTTFDNSTHMIWAFRFRRNVHGALKYANVIFYSFFLFWGYSEYYMCANCVAVLSKQRQQFLIYSILSLKKLNFFFQKKKKT